MSLDLGKTARQNRLVSYLSKTNQDNALSISDFYQRLVGNGFDVTRKTVERDLDELTLQHSGLQEKEGRPKKFYFEEGYQVHYSIKFEQQHLQTIIIALDNLQAMTCPTIASLCRETEDVLLNKLSAYDRNDFNNLKGKSSIGKTILGKPEATQKETYKLIFDCLQQEKAFLCDYKSPYDTIAEKRLFHPLMLHLVGGAPYLFVYDPLDENKIKLLRLSRIQSAEMTNHPVDLDLKKEIDLDYSFGAYGTGQERILNYTIYCKAPMAGKFREHQIHESQVIQRLDEDLYRIEFTLNDSYEIIKYLAQFGESIKSIEPEEVYLKVKRIWEAGLKVA
jgi:predicted DNA-binding transcriptional regulator YafY